MADLLFEIEYVDRHTGGVVTKKVGSMKLAQKLARELAMAHGRVAKIKPNRREEWKVITVDLATGEVDKSNQLLTKKEAFVACHQWKAKQAFAVCVPWPTWAPDPTITIVLRRGA